MSDERSPLQALRDASAPDSGSSERLLARVLAETGESPLTQWLQALPEPDFEVRDRLAAHLLDAHPLPVRQTTAPILLVAALALLAAAVFWPGRPSPTLAERSSPEGHVLPAPPPTPPALAATVQLSSLERWQTVQVDAFVTLDGLGEGTVGRSGSHTDVAWTLGELRVQVAPDQGRTLRVRTAEAEIEVIGTEFAVVRDVWGTRVSVARGKVGVRCAEGEPVVLTAGAIHRCLPSTPLDLLTLANRLEREDASATEILDVVARGLALDPAPRERELLLHKHMRLLDRVDQGSRALEEAEQWLAAGYGFRREDVVRLAARRALEAGGCARAAAHLAELSPSEVELLAPGCRR